MIIPGPAVTYSDLVYSIGEEEIARRYIPGFEKVNKSFRLRPCSEDKKPSSRVFIHQGTLFIKDFGDAKIEKARTILQFIRDEFNISEEEAVERILSDHSEQVKGNFGGRSKSKRKTYIDKETTLKVKYREWNNDDNLYWNTYGLTIEDLIKADIRPISYYWIDSNRVTNKMFRAEKLAYSYNYYVKNGIFRRKIYQPKSEYMKWISNCSLDVVQNYKNLPKYGDLLIIQSSLKDSLVMNKYGYISIAPISEAAFFTEEYYIKLKERFKTIIYFSNNDWNKKQNEGLLYGEKISRLYEIPTITIESEYQCSDISDYRKEYGDESTKELLCNLITI